MQNKVTHKKQDLLAKLANLNERVYQAMLLKEQFVSIYTDPNVTTDLILPLYHRSRIPPYNRFYSRRRI